jgi:transposase
MDHIGIDVHKLHSQICILTEDGELIERRVRTEPEQLAAVLGSRSRAHIVIESATERVGRAMPGGAGPRGDRRRSQFRADVRAAQPNGEDRPARRACPRGGVGLGGVPARPSAVGRPATRAGAPHGAPRAGRHADHPAVVRSLLRQHGYRVRSGGADAFLLRVRDLRMPGRLRSEIGPLLAVMRQVNQQLAYSDARIEAVTGTDPRVQLLRTVPSVGPVTAAAFVAALDDVKRFRGAHALEAYLGLVPRELSSGETQHRGRITKAGSRRVRWLLVQAAVSILRLRDPRTVALRQWAMGIAARRGKKVAVVALARRLAGILYAMLRDGTGYAPRRPSHPAAAATSAPA